MAKTVKMGKTKMPLFVVVIFGLIAPPLMGYVAYDLGRYSLREQRLADLLSADGIETTAKITAKGPCVGSGRQPVDCWFSYAYQAGGRTIERPEVRIRPFDSLNYDLGEDIKVTYSASAPNNVTHKNIAKVYENATEGFWGFVGAIFFIISMLYIATIQLIGRLPTNALALFTLIFSTGWWMGLR